ncbi:NAD(P)-binding protein [Byssothecium circinans]|uniref:NAD(P)-binding protein n=1 Tax=Byssothecium circinans TaxID=147558 RepID=A0A6A5TXX1_9PLEO|nr:NAD(P)-binding protein [Byssothecium circinans]
MATPPPTKILLLGAGELGTALLAHLVPLPNTHLTIALRNPTNHPTLSTTYPGTSLIPLDLTSPSPTLVQTFSTYDIIVSATGFSQAGGGSLLKLTREILEAGQLRREKNATGAAEARLWYFPWQWGVDYDVTGDGHGLMPLFGEQKQVRDLLRGYASACSVRWTIVSTGIFMSFLFEKFWGVVERENRVEGVGEIDVQIHGTITVRALRDWSHKVTVTDVDDIGKVLACILKGDVEAENRVVYAAGDTVSYAELADIVEKVTGRKVEREEWSVPYLEEELEKDPDNQIKKYRLVFARDGVWWDKKGTVNEKLGIKVMDVESYVHNWVERK